MLIFVYFLVGLLIGIQINDWIWGKYWEPKIDREIDEMNREFFGSKK